MGVELFIEIGCEEIPARFLTGGIEELTRQLKAVLDSGGITYGDIRSAGTPRRIAISLADCLERQPDKTIEKTGPAKSMAYDDNGNPTKAVIGFAKGQGVEVEDLIVQSTPKGEYLAVKKTIHGRDTIEILAESLPGIIESMHWPKSMKWGTLASRFVRPVQWIVALFDGATIDFEIFGLKSGNESKGHRFLSPAFVEVTGFDDYISKLRGSNVITLIEERRNFIHGELERIGRELNGKVIEDNWLVEHVSNLVEFPVALTGSFPEKYLALPREILITSMRDHQKYFVVENEKGELLPRFVTISNMLVPDPKVVIKGNERVLVARLEDARFYFEEDLKTPLDDMVQSLSGVMYQADLGSYAEKTQRVRKLVAHLAKTLVPDGAADADRAATLAKADLVSGVVGEFPELQGIMGAHYARYAKEPDCVADAIFEHYLPKGQGADLPKHEIGALVGIADKLDSICGCFGVGLAPTGSGDPFALRRLALGIIHILENRGWSMDLPETIHLALEGVMDKILKKNPKTDPAELEEKIVEFFRQRLGFLLKGQGFAVGAVDAVLCVRFQDLAEVKSRAEAVAEFAKADEFEPFAAAFKRVANILAAAKDDFKNAVIDSALFEGEAEAELLKAVEGVKNTVADKVKAGDHLGALVTIASIRPQVDRFFDETLVMHEKDDVRINRLALLNLVGGMFQDIADFKRL